MKKTIYITLCIIGILSFSCEKEKIETDPKKAILGKWEIVEDGNWPDLEPCQATQYVEYLPDSLIRVYDYKTGVYIYAKEKYWIDSLYHEGVYREDGYFLNVSYKYQFSDNNNKLRLDIQAFAIINTFIYKRLK